MTIAIPIFMSISASMIFKSLAKHSIDTFHKTATNLLKNNIFPFFFSVFLNSSLLWYPKI